MYYAKLTSILPTRLQLNLALCFSQRFNAMGWHWRRAGQVVWRIHNSFHWIVSGWEKNEGMCKYNCCSKWDVLICISCFYKIDFSKKNP